MTPRLSSRSLACLTTIWTTTSCSPTRLIASVGVTGFGSSAVAGGPTGANTSPTIRNAVRTGSPLECHASAGSIAGPTGHQLHGGRLDQRRYFGPLAEVQIRGRRAGDDGHQGKPAV